MTDKENTQDFIQWISLSNQSSEYETDYPKIKGGFTRRNTSLPENGNTALHVCQSKEDVMKNRRRLEKILLPLENWVLPWQKHTDRIVRVTHEDILKGAFDKNTSIMDTDGLYTTEKDLLIGVFTADCLGILLADPKTGLIGAVHSGWKGTVQNILYKMLHEIFDQNLSSPDSLKIFFSPSIQKQSFQIGEDVKKQLEDSGKEIGLDYSDFFEADPDEHGKWFADHQAMNLRICKTMNIPDHHVFANSQDTKTDPTCFSFRRDKNLTGEHLSFIYMED
ncbi:peptidoglycan editing factor PgeF [Ileibacterium valens]|uniref:peptidoglycan editing factor PgeF n=1 Tax=Ileibacterium valens TaxID=1862668 RepID=UPI0023538111|nr:peptidoglycan editing factor PgeF [Ileibacterium valens]